MTTRHNLRTLDFPRVVCLCGSTRFYEDFQRVNYELTMKGVIVLTVGFYPHAQEQVHGEEKGCTPEQKKALDELHLRKIDLADGIFVINKGGYVGESTLREILYAAVNEKSVEWMEEPTDGEVEWFYANSERIGEACRWIFTEEGSENEVEETVVLDDDVPRLGKKGDVVSGIMFVGHAFAMAFEKGYEEGNADESEEEPDDEEDFSESFKRAVKSRAGEGKAP